MFGPLLFGRSARCRSCARRRSASSSPPCSASTRWWWWPSGTSLFSGSTRGTTPVCTPWRARSGCCTWWRCSRSGAGTPSAGGTGGPPQRVRRRRHAPQHDGGGGARRAQRFRPGRVAQVAHRDARVAADAAARQGAPVQGDHQHVLRADPQPVPAAVRVLRHRVRLRHVRRAAVRRAVDRGNPRWRARVRRGGVLRPELERLPQRAGHAGVPVHREQLVRGDGRLRRHDRQRPRACTS